jgi:cobalt-zinc-cadmium resistance protein CzcA
MNPIAFAILIIIVVFLPLFSLTGLEGKLFKPMALTITFAMVGSLMLTLTLVPVLSALILKPKEEKDTFLVRWAKRLYLPLLDWALENKKQGHSVRRVGLLVAALATFPVPRQGVHAQPAGRRDHVPRHRHSLDFAGRKHRASPSAFDADLKQKFPQVESTLATIGRAEKGETADVNYMEVLVDVKPQGEWPKRMISMPELGTDAGVHGESHPNGGLGATQPIQMRVEELISGVRATLALKIYGEDLTTLDRLAARKGVLDKVPGVADLALEANKGKPQWWSR